MSRFRLRIGSIAALLAVLVVHSGCVQEARWVGSYSVVVRVRPSEDRAIVGVVAQPLHKSEYDSAVARLGSPLANSPRYFDLFEMDTRQPSPLPEGGAVEVSVRTTGVDRTFPWPATVSQQRQEKLALGIYYVDGSRDCYIFDIPAADQPREVTAEIPTGKGEQSLAAESR